MREAHPDSRRFAIFSVASVLFGWHAGGGFATGNQANQYYISSGWLGVPSALLALLLLTLTIRQAIVMYEQRGLGSCKELIETLYHPLDKLEILFEIYYYLMVLMSVGTCIAGAGTLLVDALGLPYLLSVVLIGLILLVLTMFGADVVRRVSSVLSTLILVCAVTIFIVGICRRTGAIGQALTAGVSGGTVGRAVLKSFQYAGFQCASIPTMIACASVLKSRQEAAKAMWLAFATNAAALCLSIFMLLGWQDVYTGVEGGATIPTLTVCKAMGVAPLVWAYYLCLFLCFISSGTMAVFGVTTRFEALPALRRRVSQERHRRMTGAALVLAAAVGISLAGLTNIIRFGYGYCGYVGIAILVVPFLTVGAYKNRRYALAHPEAFADPR